MWVSTRDRPAQQILEGNRVVLVDPLLTVCSSEKIPLLITYRPARVVRRYKSLVDVVFDHRPETVSHGHNIDCVKFETINVIEREFIKSRRRVFVSLNAFIHHQTSDGEL